MPIRVTARPAALVLLAALTVGACGSADATLAPATAAPATASPAASASSPAASAAPVDGEQIAIVNFSFGEETVTVAAGTTVTWTNEDSVPHTVTATDGSFDSGNLSNGATFSQAFDAPGTYAYDCTIHPSMTATVVVE